MSVQTKHNTRIINGQITLNLALFINILIFLDMKLKLVFFLGLVMNHLFSMGE